MNNSFLQLHLYITLYIFTVTMAAVLSITDVFNDYDSMKDLLTRIGLSRPCTIRLMDEEGFETAADLVTTDLKDLQNAIDYVNKAFGNKTGAGRIYFPPNRITRVKALAVYLKRCHTINSIPDIRLIDLAKVNDFVLKFPSWTGKADETDDVVKNKDVKFEPTKFKSFRDDFNTLLCAIRGGRGITLEYIIRNDPYVRSPPAEIPEPDVDSNDIIAANATLHGPEFDHDNARVYTILRTILTGTTGWNIISRFAARRDGRNAFIALKAHFQGNSYFDFMRSQASNLMSKTFYNGDKQKFKWEDFVAIHMEAHSLYEETGEALSETMKIMNLKANIRDGAGLENTIEAARTSPATNATFDSYVNFLTEGITSKRGRAETFKISHPRQVSATRQSFKQNNNNRFTRGGKYRGQNGGSKSFNKTKSFQCEGKTLYPHKSYSNSEYNALSKGQKEALKQAHRSRKTLNADDRTVASQLTTDSITQISDAIIAGVTRAQSDNGSGNNSTDSSAEAQSVASQFKKRRTES